MFRKDIWSHSRRETHHCVVEIPVYFVYNQVCSTEETFLLDFLETLKHWLQNFNKILKKCFVVNRYQTDDRMNIVTTFTCVHRDRNIYYFDSTADSHLVRCVRTRPGCRDSWGKRLFSRRHIWNVLKYKHSMIWMLEEEYQKKNTEIHVLLDVKMTFRKKHSLLKFLQKVLT